MVSLIGVWLYIREGQEHGNQTRLDGFDVVSRSRAIAMDRGERLVGSSQVKSFCWLRWVWAFYCS